MPAITIGAELMGIAEEIGNILTIFRVFHNYMHAGDDKQTPAMRLGLAKGPVKYADVLYFT